MGIDLSSFPKLWVSSRGISKEKGGDRENLGGSLTTASQHVFNSLNLREQVLSPAPIPMGKSGQEELNV